MRPGGARVRRGVGRGSCPGQRRAASLAAGAVPEGLEAARDSPMCPGPVGARTLRWPLLGTGAVRIPEQPCPARPVPPASGQRSSAALPARVCRSGYRGAAAGPAPGRPDCAPGTGWAQPALSRAGAAAEPKRVLIQSRFSCQRQNHSRLHPEPREALLEPPEQQLGRT